MRGLVTGLVGFVVGGLAGAVYMRYKKEKEMDLIINEYEEEIDELIEEINAIEEETSDMIEEQEVDVQAEEMPEYEEELPNGYFDYGSKAKRKQRFRDPMDKPASPKDLLTEHPEDSDEDDDILEESPIKGSEEVDMPKLISADKYDEDPSYDKDTLYYYQEDDILTNADDEEIENPYEYVGDCLDKFDFRGTEEPLIHVRNDEKGTDYEVQKVYAAFHS